MNILIIGTTDIQGGAAKVSWTLKEAMEKEGHTVSMFVADKRSADSKVHVIPRQPWRKYLGFLLATDDLLSSDWILDTKEFKEADIVHAHNIHGRFFNLQTLQKMSRSKPVVWTLHDEWALTPSCAYTLEGTAIENGLYVCPSIDIPPRLLWNNSKYLSWRKKKIYSESILNIVTPCAWLENRARKTVLSNQNIRLIYNGIDTDRFKRISQREAREALGLPLDKKIVLFLANDAKNNTWKGWKYTEEVIDAYKENPDILFLNVGNLVEHQSGSRVIYKGYAKTPEELRLYYSAVDALLLTSIAENFPLVILEAMSCGLPIVAFDVGGVKEAVEHKVYGYVGAYKNTKDLVFGLNWLFSKNGKELEDMKACAERIAREKFKEKDMVEKYKKMYAELLEKN